ncbi:MULTISPECIES: hypothetical protein [unclassified Pseudomonas]|uniref:BufA2 family periplasmic bufferin-type metallophore n=1 Tax=unclassified Pseudomonas TaxID=196821 RepID=UPI001EE08653|nr:MULTISPECIES: hypothetical protein [unclassified Pseudomonas]MCG4452866.1 hypothetical protein [Pseudomonas sp. MMS21 TM103]
MSTISSAVTGAALALVAAGLFASLPAQAAQDAQTAQVQCYGVNACKGQNDCMTATNACKGEGACKGQGFNLMTQAKCDEAGGKTGK